MDDWVPLEFISNFEYEEGYEYRIRVVREKYHNGELQDAGLYRYTLVEIISKIRKDSADIPPQSIALEIAGKINSPTSNKDVYLARITGGDWVPFPNIEGFNYEEGYEYTIYAQRICNGRDKEPFFTWKYQETITKMNSE